MHGPVPPARSWRTAPLVLGLLAACGPAAAPEPAPAPPPPGYPAPGSPLSGLVPGQWSWVEFADSACDEGTPTGIGVSPGTGPDLLVFLNGGGACWDYLTCYALNLASHGPYGAAEFEDLRARSLPGSILDRGLAGNPFADASMVFVPYCTGDIHGGDRVATYALGGASRVHRHVGRPNLIAFLRRLAATFPSARLLVVAGSSAGGFGAVINYEAFRHYWPATPAVLVDDSGPPLRASGAAPGQVALWYEAWNLGPALDPVCGAACRTDLSAMLPALARRHPGDRMALLSSLRDQVISGYYALPGARLEEELLGLASEVIAPLPGARHFYVAGATHTMLGAPASFAQGVPLLEWLSQQAAGDPAWRSRQP